MLNIVIFILFCYGLTQIIVYGKIFETIREKLQLYVLKCPMCLSFWVGIFAYIVFWFSGIRLFPNLYVGMFVYGALSSGSSYFIIMLVSDSGINININKE